MKKNLNNILKKSILTRQSTRTYSGKKLSEKEVDKIKELINHEEFKKGIFGNVRFELLENTNNSVIDSKFPFENPPSYIAVISKNNRESMLDIGFTMEKVILFLESMNLGTCWIASHFNRKNVKLENPLKEGESVPVITPVGEKAKKRSRSDVKSRIVYNSDNRNDFDKLFFNYPKFGVIKNKETRKILEYVRLAPSAVNKQPWRIIMTEYNAAHFYISRSYSGGHYFDIQTIDLGIAIAHYVIASGNDNYIDKNPKIKFEKNMDYVLSIN